MKNYSMIMAITVFAVGIQLQCSEQKVNQVAANKLGDQLIKLVDSNHFNLANITSLINRGANINAENYLGYSLLTHFIFTKFEKPVKNNNNIAQKDIEILKFLLRQKNINVNSVDINGFSPFDSFVDFISNNAKAVNSQIQPNSIKEILKLFFARGALINIYRKNPFGKNFFDYAKENELLQQAYDEYLAELRKKFSAFQEIKQVPIKREPNE